LKTKQRYQHWLTGNHLRRLSANP